MLLNCSANVWHKVSVPNLLAKKSREVLPYLVKDSLSVFSVYLKLDRLSLIDSGEKERNLHSKT